MKTPARKERAALAHVAKIADAELTRWTMWEAIAPIDRARALSLAGMPKERAVQPLASFTDDERARIRTAVEIHLSRMAVIVQCLNASNTTRAGFLH
jgi:hypothetical protein